MSAFRESRLGNGTLTLGPVGTGQIDMSCQLTNALIKSSYDDDGDAVTVLCGTTVPAPRKLSGRTLDGTFVQDFDFQEADGGIIDYVWNHDLEVVDFSFTPDDAATAPTLTGTLRLEVPESTYGGDVGTRLTSDFSWSIQAAITRTYAAGTAAEPETVSA
jgi:hypothetical protein